MLVRHLRLQDWLHFESICDELVDLAFNPWVHISCRPEMAGVNIHDAAKIKNST